MPAETASLDYSLNTLRREFNDEFPDTTLIFIMHRTGQREEALQKRQEEIFEHPAGHILWPQLKIAARDHDSHSSGLAGFSRTDRNRYFNLVKKEVFLAVFFVNTDNTENREDSAFANRHLGYGLIWHALSMRTSWKKKHPDIKNHEGVLSMPLSRAERLRRQMMADCFAAMMLETKGEKGAISRLLKWRCELSLLPAVRYRPEDFPFPVALDATHLVYKDLKDAAPTGTGAAAHCFFMAQEIGQTYDDLSLKQWGAFCRAAQEMAWAGHNRSDILGAAVYTSDDAYIRSAAYIVAETLNTDPVPPRHNDFYNPFAEDEVNERLHMRRCRNVLDAITDKIEEKKDPSLFIKEAQRLNIAFLEGEPSGWCSLPLLAAYGAYNSASGTGENSPLDNAAGAFHGTLAQTGWPKTRKLHRLIVNARRSGEKITPEKAALLVAEDAELSILKTAFVLRELL